MKAEARCEGEMATKNAEKKGEGGEGPEREVRSVFLSERGYAELFAFDSAENG